MSNKSVSGRSMPKTSVSKVVSGESASGNRIRRVAPGFRGRAPGTGIAAAVAVLLVFSLVSCSAGDAGEEAATDSGGPRAAEAASAPSDDEASRQPDSESWLLLEGTDAGAGAAEIELAREASRGANSTGIPPTLHLRCIGGEPEVIIVWYEDPEGADNDVTTQIGDSEPIRRTWTNRHEDSTVFPSDSAAVFMQRLMEADSLTVRTNLYKRMPVSVVFGLDGLSERVTPLREACGW